MAGHRLRTVRDVASRTLSSNGPATVVAVSLFMLLLSRVVGYDTAVC